MESAIKVKNLSKVFYNKKKETEKEREVWALKNASFEVKRGEIFGLLGPNGAGKTTAIRCIAGLLKPYSGTVQVNGENIQEESHLFRKKMGFLTENHGNYEQLSVYDNLSFFGSFYDIEDIDQRIEDVLTSMGLYDRKNLRAGKLSKGQKQRLAIARAILHDPEILFFDEPTSGLDPIASVKVRELILGLKGKNRTIFINSHNLEEVQKTCDRVAILDLGEIKRIGTPAELRKDLFKTQEMTCTLKNPVTQQMKDMLTRLDNIKQYRIENDKIFVYADDIDETTPEIVKKLVSLDAKILDVSRTIHSLEDIYIKLMEDEDLPK